MTDPNDPPNFDPGKYTPLAAEEAAMKSGRWRMIVGMIVAVAAVIAGFVWFVAGDEKVAAASNYGRALNGAHQEHVEAFWSCALSGEQIKDLRTESELAAQLNGRAAGGRDRYATQLRERCGAPCARAPFDEMG